MAMPNSSKVAIAIRITPRDADPIWLTSVDDNTVQASSTVTEYPIVDGSLVADHMFKEPVTYSISGTWGYNNLDTYKVPKNNALLSTFQKTFEDIKNNGTICDIVKITTRENGPQFLKRTNMILQSLSWTEGTNNLSYTFTFRQVLSQEIGVQDIDTTDIFLPQYEELLSLNFTDTLIDWSLMDKLIVKFCYDSKIIDDEFLDFIQTDGYPAIAVALGASAVAIVKTATAIGAWKAVASAGVMVAVKATAKALGWIGIAIILIITAAEIVEAAIKEKDRKKLVFKSTTEDAIRFAEFILEVHNALLVLNSSIHIYQISNNSPHEAVLGIEDMYYIFKFYKDNLTSGWQVDVRNINEDVICSKYPLAAHAVPIKKPGTKNLYNSNMQPY